MSKRIPQDAARRREVTEVESKPRIPCRSHRGKSDLSRPSLKAFRAGDLLRRPHHTQRRHLGWRRDLPFWICNANSHWSSFDPTIASRDGVDHHQINISCRRFRSILEEFGTPYYLKIDIEGNDTYCLQDLTGVDLPKYVLLERSDRAVESLNLLHNLGYTGFKLISQFNFLPLEYPPTREQKRYEMLTRLLESRMVVIRAVRARCNGLARTTDRVIPFRDGWSFPPGTSGPFGEDLPGKWQSHAEIVETLKNADHSRDRGDRSPFWNNKDYGFWADFHAVRKN